MQRTQELARRRDRFPVEIEAVVHRNDGSRFPVKVSNFSDQGCRIDTAEPVRVGERLQIAVPRMGNMKAQVRWALPGAAGTRFLTDSDF
jgi:hypothetical protein